MVRNYHKFLKEREIEKVQQALAPSLNSASAENSSDSIRPVVSGTSGTLENTATLAVSEEDQKQERDQTVNKKETKLTPAALRHYEVFRKIDIKHFLSDEEFNKVCLIVCGDRRRIFQRVLLGMYQRAHVKSDEEEIKRVRLLMALHERGVLLQNLDLYL